MAKSVDFKSLYPFNQSLAEDMERLFGQEEDEENRKSRWSNSKQIESKNIGSMEKILASQTQEGSLRITKRKESMQISMQSCLCAYSAVAPTVDKTPSLMFNCQQTSVITFEKSDHEEVITTKCLINECAFCKKNQEQISFFQSHSLKDSDGKITCPVLRAYVCPLCGATGDNAHTVQHCPKNPDKKSPATVLILKAARKSAGTRSYYSAEGHVF